MITVSVLLFASYADALGRSSLELTLAPPATVDDVVAHVRALPGAERLPSRPLVAVNQAYAGAAGSAAALAHGDEVAILPPVAGG
jgi:molybdopterin converting factor small subunit